MVRQEDLGARVVGERAVVEVEESGAAQRLLGVDVRLQLEIEGRYLSEAGASGPDVDGSVV